MLTLLLRSKEIVVAQVGSDKDIGAHLLNLW